MVHDERGSPVADCTQELANPETPATVDHFERAPRPLERSSEITDRAPLSHIQQRFWIIDRAIADRAVYNVCYRMRLHGPLDVAAFRHAWTAVVNRQESLRTQFVSEEGTIVQMVLDSVPCAVPLVDLRDRPVELDAEIAREARLTFDLTTAPLWRVSLYRIGDDEHVLFWNIHHIIIDQGSRAVILRDLWAAYDCAAAGNDPRLEPLKVRYTDFSVWQLAHLDETRLRQGLAQCKKRLAGVAPAALPPYFKPRPKMRSWAGGLHRFAMPSRISDASAAFSARQAGVTPFVVYLAAFQALLFRYSNQTDICVGTVASSRGRSRWNPNRLSGAIDEVAGCFVNTAVVRVDLGGEPTFRELVARAREAVADAIKHADVPLERIADEVRSGRSGGTQPLFQCAFVYHNGDVHGRTATGLAWEVEPTAQAGAKFDLTLEVFETPRGGMVAGIEYNADLYDEADARRIAGHYLTLLEQACWAPETPVSRLPLLAPDQYRQIVFDWNRTAAPYPADAVIQQGFEDRARQAPDRVAIVAGGREFTFGEIDARANQLAHFLIGRGLATGAFAAVCLSRSEEMIVAVMAVLKAGGAYVPFDATYPKDRLAFMLRDTRTALVITQSSLLDRLPEPVSTGDDAPPVYLCLDRLERELARQNAGAPKRLTTPDDRAYVIFTSGSTGRPKGVLLRHRPVVNVLDWVNQTFGVGPSDRLLFVTSLSFDLSVYDIFGALGAGASIRIASEKELRDPTALLRILKTEPITIWDSAPAALSQLAPFFTPDATEKRIPAALRLVMLSGDWIPVPLPDQVRGEFPEARVVSLGGATEAAIWSNWYPIGSVDPGWPSIPYGKPIRNARYHILDAWLQPVPVGVPGELHIGGDVLADGYLNRDELTRERFIDDPLAEAVKSDCLGAGNLAVEENGDAPARGWPAGGRLYKTGDLARYLPDGNIEFLGRIDTQVKVRGFRVEAGEIETILARQDGVQDTVVIPRKDASGQNYLVAYIVPKPGRLPSAPDIFRDLRKHLPEYMVPAQMVLLDALPVTRNGKVDRGLLPAPDGNAGGDRREYVSPANDAERALQPIWEEVFGIKPIGVTDNFYQLGGHSILAAILMSKIELRLGQKLPLETLVHAPTVRGLSFAMQQQLEVGNGVLVPLQTTGNRPPFFVIPGAGGHVFTFYEIAHALGPRFNVYSLKAVGVDGAESPLDSVEQIAQRYFEEITACVPDGPCVVGGYSVGGLIAFELALRLQTAGRKVNRVIVFDVMAPGCSRKISLPRRVWRHLRRFVGLPGREKGSYLRDLCRNVQRRIQFKLGFYHATVNEVPGVEHVSQERLKLVVAGLVKASHNYRPKRVFDGRLVVIGSSLPSDGFEAVPDNPLLGWSRWSTQTVQFYSVPAPHLELFRSEYRHYLIPQLRTVLDEVKAEEEAAGLSSV